MAGQTLLNIGIVLVLIIIEALCVAGEISLVSLRDGQVRAMAETGRRGAAVAKLVRDPNRFLATVQIGVTTTALLSSAFGAVTLSDEAAQFLIVHGMGEGLANVIGVVGVTLIITFVTLVIGELAPKRLGLQRPEATAKGLAPTLNRMASVFRPVIWLLSRSTNGFVRILGGDPSAGRDSISAEELRGLVAAHESLSTDERSLIDDVFAASDRAIGEIMVPRTEVVFLDAALTVSEARAIVIDEPHERYPVVGRTSDDVLGFVHIRDLVLGENLHERRVRSLVRQVKAMPATKRVLTALSEMRSEGHHLAIVVDEYGGTDGIVTLEDLVEEVIGDIREEGGLPAEDDPRRLSGGVVELDGKENLDEVREVTGLELPEGPYATLGGYVMAELGRLPGLHDRVSHDGYLLDVVEVEGRRAARVRVTPPEPEPQAGSGGTPVDATIDAHG